MQKEFYFHTTITPNDIDGSDHVNNARYLNIFEEARWSCFKGTCYDKPDIYSLGFAPVLIDCTIKFRKELILNELIYVNTCITGIKKNLIIHMKQTIFNQAEQKVCIANLRHGMLDLKARKMIEFPKDWLEI